MFDFIFTVLAFIFALGLLVSIHEFGHFWVARKCGVKVLRFSIGFGKPFWTYQKNSNSTEYALAAIPLGGYVKMLDEREGEVAAAELDQAFNRQHVSKRIAIVAAGPMFNFILAIILYSLVAMLGVMDIKPIVGEVTENSIAAKAGLRYEDKITSVGNKTVRSWSQARLAIIESALSGNEIALTIDRDYNEMQIRLDLQGRKLLQDEQDVIEKLGIAVYQPTNTPVIGGLVPNYPAEQADLQVGDIIRKADEVSLQSWNEWASYIRARPEQLVRLEIDRAGNIFAIDIVPKAEVQGDATIGLVGVQYQPQHLEKIQYGFFPAIAYAANKTWDMSVLMLKMLTKLIVGDVSPKNISGPITIAEYAGKTASLDVRYYIDFIAIISISLGVLNLLPIPLLDGGHLLYYFVEIITRKPVSERVQIIGQQFGIILLGLLMMLAFYNDITRLLN